MRNVLKLATVLVAVSTAIFVVQPAFAQATKPAVPADATAKDLFKEGERLLTKGRNFERAITVLREAVIAEPQNSDYTLALGCAYASRAYTLSQALDAVKTYPVYAKRHERAIRVWQTGQSNPNSPVFGIARPEAERPLPRTEDDKRVFRMDAKSVEAAEKRVKALCAAAWQRLEEGVRLCENDTRERRADALSLQAWCHILVWLEPRAVVRGSWPEKKERVPANLIGALEVVATVQPENISRLRSVGDACILFSEHERSGDPALRAKGLSLLEAVLNQQPADAMLCLRISTLRAIRRIVGGTTNSPLSNVAVMKLAVKENPTNASLWYGLFAAAGDAKDYTEAFAALESGNAAPLMKWPFYHITTHSWVSWAFSPTPISYSRQTTQALKNLSTFVRNDQEDPVKSLIRFKRAVLRMTHRYNAAFLQPDLSVKERDMYEWGRWKSSDFGRIVPPLLESVFPQTAEDKRLLNEAQTIWQQNQAQLAAEETMGVLFTPK